MSLLNLSMNSITVNFLNFIRNTTFETDQVTFTKPLRFSKRNF